MLYFHAQYVIIHIFKISIFLLFFSNFMRLRRNRWRYKLDFWVLRPKKLHIWCKNSNFFSSVFSKKNHNFSTCFVNFLKTLKKKLPELFFISLESLKSLLLGGANRLFENTMVAYLWKFGKFIRNRVHFWVKPDD